MKRAKENNNSSLSKKQKMEDSATSLHASLRQLSTESNDYVSDPVSMHALIERDAREDDRKLEKAEYLEDFIEKPYKYHTLDAGNQDAHDGMCKAISEKLIRNDTLTSLDLYSNAISKQGAIDLAEGLKSNDILKYLNLNKNNIGSEGAVALAQMLQSNKSLNRLDLGENNIGNEGANSILQALLQNHTLTHLELGNNGLDAEIANHLSDVLTKNTSLKILKLAQNSLGDEALETVANALGNNGTLTTLIIGQNDITNKGVSDIASGLGRNHSLTELELPYNSITSDGAQDLVNLLKSNYSLRHVDIKSKYYHPKKDLLDNIQKYCASNEAIYKSTKKDLSLIKVESITPESLLKSDSSLISSLSFYYSIRPDIEVSQEVDKGLIDKSMYYFFLLNAVCKEFIIHGKDNNQGKEGYYIPHDALMIISQHLTNLDIKHVGIQLLKDITINAIREDLKIFKEQNSVETLKQEIKKSCSDIKDYYVYSVLLSAAIVLEDEEAVNDILKINQLNILTQPDGTGYSPIANTFCSGNINILSSIKEYIKAHKEDPEFKSSICKKDDQIEIFNAMRFPKLKEMNYKEAYMNILEPLYQDTAPFVELLDTFEWSQSNYEAMVSSKELDTITAKLIGSLDLSTLNVNEEIEYEGW